MPEEGQRLYKMWTTTEKRDMSERAEAARNPSFEVAKKILSQTSAIELAR